MLRGRRRGPGYFRFPLPKENDRLTAELEKSEEKFRYLLETLSDMIAGYLDRQDIE
jgi:hypothetical protein